MADVNRIKLPDGNTYNLIDALGRKEAYLEWGGKNFAGSYGCIDAAMVSDLNANRFSFLKKAGITIEYTRDGGTTWTDYGASEGATVGLFNPGNSFAIGKADSTNKATAHGTNYQLRVTINAASASIYTEIKKIIIYCSTNGSADCKCQIFGTLKPSTDYTKITDPVAIAGWSGYNVIQTGFTIGNSFNGQYNNVRFLFTANGGNTTYTGLTIFQILGFGGVGWTTPSTMAKLGHLYSYDGLQNATFPAQVSATKFNGTATNADKVNNLTVQTAVPANAKFTDTTYESKAAASGGTAVSLCTTGEKYTWNNKSNLTLGTTSTTALKGDTKYAGSSSAGGSATSAVKLDTATAGSATQPCYFTGGKPSACTYSLNKTVPSNAVFTDTRVKQTLKNTEGYAYPILFSKINASDSGDYAPDEVYRNNSFRILTEADHSIATVSLYNKDDAMTISLQGPNGNIKCSTVNGHTVPSVAFGYTRHTFTSSTTLSYTGKSVTCPTGKRMIVRAYFRYVNNGPQQVLASLNSTAYGNYYSEVLDHKNGGIGGCLNFMLNSGETAYYWAKYAGAGTNYIDETTITFTES